MVIKKKGKKKDLESLAKQMFEAGEKEAYYLGDLMISNLEELVEHLDRFTEEEAHWVASWIEYLGDVTCAKDIKKCPNKFKDIVKKRYAQLNKHRTV